MMSKILIWRDLAPLTDPLVGGAVIELDAKVGQVVIELGNGTVTYTVVEIEGEALTYGAFEQSGKTSYNVPEVNDNYDAAAELWNTQEPRSEIWWPQKEDLIHDSWENMIIRLV